MKPPRIRPADGRNSEFHDSGLIEFRVSPTFDWMVIVVSTPDEGGGENQWQIKFTGLLRLEFETSGNGAGETFPGEIYDIYEFADSDERSRWVKRLSVLEDLQVQNDHANLRTVHGCPTTTTAMVGRVVSSLSGHPHLLRLVFDRLRTERCGD